MVSIAGDELSCDSLAQAKLGASDAVSNRLAAITVFIVHSVTRYSEFKFAMDSN